MIKFFLLDLDGCLTYPFKSPDWRAVTEIRALQSQSRYDEHIPALSLCTGRPLPYAEAVAQWMGIRDTIIFESGGGFYHPVTNKLTWSAHFTKEIEMQSNEIREWFVKVIKKDFPGMMLEFAKHTDVGLVHTSEDEIRRVYDIATRKIGEEYPDFEVHMTNVSVNIIVKKCNKATGLQFFADQYGLDAREVAYIGDTSGDVMALEWAGAPFAPSNAAEEVKKRASVMQGEATLGVLEAYRAIIDRNRALMSQSAAGK